MPEKPKSLVSSDTIATMVHWIRHEKVMLDSDLATLYGVEARALNQAVKRNSMRFPADFMFQLSPEEAGVLTHSSQSVMSSRKHRGLVYLPYAFTEQGVSMLSSVLRSQRAVEVNIAIMRAFVQLRRLMDSNRELAEKIAELEDKYDGQFRLVFDAIRQLMSTSAQPTREMGFHAIPDAGKK
ncbi:MAG: ORF6N domain-containing protein [Verrucomicrobiota bacterium]